MDLGHEYGPSMTSLPAPWHRLLDLFTSLAQDLLVLLAQLVKLLLHPLVRLDLPAHRLVAHLKRSRNHGNEALK